MTLSDGIVVGIMSAAIGSIFVKWAMDARLTKIELHLERLSREIGGEDGGGNDRWTTTEAGDDDADWWKDK